MNLMPTVKFLYATMPASLRAHEVECPSALRTQRAQSLGLWELNKRRRIHQGYPRLLGITRNCPGSLFRSFFHYRHGTPFFKVFGVNLGPTCLPTWRQNPPKIVPRGVQMPSQIASYLTCVFFYFGSKPLGLKFGWFWASN